MNRLETRLAKLERLKRPEWLHWIRLIAKEGESDHDCVLRHGYNPDGEFNFIIRNLVSATDRGHE